MAPELPKYLEDFQCPRTGGRLIEDSDQVRTSARAELATTYPVVDGIPNFLRYEPSVPEDFSSQLDELVVETEKTGWRKAMEKVFGVNSGMERYVDTPERYSFLDLLSIDDTSVVLEVGTGLGAITPEIAKRAGRLFALEILFEQARFTSLRCQEEGADNVRFAVGGDDNLLPFPNQSMDLVILNLVFEWCASRNIEKPGTLGQQQMLREVNRVLRPGGTVFLSTKNRFALRLFTGQRDEHAYEMRFGHVLPFWLMRLVLRIHGHNQPRGRIYSYRVLKKMLKDAGFIDLTSYWAAPEMRYPTHFIPSNARAIRAARRKPDFQQGDTRRTRLMMKLIPAGLVKYFTPGLTFIAEKPAVDADNDTP